MVSVVKWVEVLLFAELSLLASVQNQNSTGITVVPSLGRSTDPAAASSECEYRFPRFRVQEAACDMLKYEGPHCRKVNDANEWECIKKRALMHDHRSCECYDKKRSQNFDSCRFVEFCVFVRENFHCESGNNCTLSKDQLLSCQRNGSEPFFVNCTHSLLYIQIEKLHELYDRREITAIFRQLFEEQCADQYGDEFLQHSVWYYVDSTHFNNFSSEYGDIYSIVRNSSEVNAHQLCWNEPRNNGNGDQSDDDQRNLWKYILVILVVLAAIVGAMYAGWRWKQYQALEDKLWRKSLERCIVQEKFIFQNAAFEIEKPLSAHEKIDKVVPGDIPPALSAEKIEGQLCMTASDFNGVAPIDNKLDAAEGSIGADGHTPPSSIFFENVSYSGVSRAPIDSAIAADFSRSNFSTTAAPNLSTASDRKPYMNQFSSVSVFDGYMTKGTSGDPLSATSRSPDDSGFPASPSTYVQTYYINRSPSMAPSDGDENILSAGASRDGGGPPS